MHYVKLKFEDKYQLYPFNSREEAQSNAVALSVIWRRRHAEEIDPTIPAVGFVIDCTGEPWPAPDDEG